MKKLVSAVLVLLLAALLCSCASASSAFVDDGIYAAYSGIVKKNCADYSPECSYDETNNVFLIHLTLSGIAEGSYSVRSALAETWETVREGQRDLCETNYSGLKDLGYDVNCQITLVDNSGSTPIAMIICYNGVVLYDYMQE